MGGVPKFMGQPGFPVGAFHQIHITCSIQQILLQGEMDFVDLVVLFLAFNMGPHAVHLRDDFTFAIQGAATWTVSESLGALHVTNQFGMTQNALPTGLAAEHFLFDPFLSLKYGTHWDSLGLR